MRLRIFIRRLVRPSVRLVLFSNEGYGRFWSHQMKSKSMTDNEVVASDVPPWFLFFGNQLSIVGKKGTSAMVLHLSSSFTSDSMILCSWHSLTSLKHRLVNAFQPLAEPTDRRTGQTTDERTYLLIQMWKCVIRRCVILKKQIYATLDPENAVLLYLLQCRRILFTTVLVDWPKLAIQCEV